MGRGREDAGGAEGSSGSPASKRARCGSREAGGWGWGAARPPVARDGEGCEGEGEGTGEGEGAGEGSGGGGRGASGGSVSDASFEWAGLPGPVMLQVMRKLSLGELSRAACVCREWRDLAGLAEPGVARATGVVRLSGVGALADGPAGGGRACDGGPGACWDGVEMTVVDVGQGNPGDLEKLGKFGDTLKRVILLGAVDQETGRKIYAEGLIRMAARLPNLDVVIVDPERTLGCPFTEKDRHGVVVTHSACFMDHMSAAEMSAPRNSAAAAATAEDAQEGPSREVNRIFHLYPSPERNGEPAMQGIGDLMRATEQFLVDRANRRARGAASPDPAALDRVDRAERLRELRLETWAMAFQLAGVTNLDTTATPNPLPFDGRLLESAQPNLRLGWGAAVRAELTQMDRLPDELGARREFIRAMHRRVGQIRRAVRSQQSLEEVREAEGSGSSSHRGWMPRAFARRTPPPGDSGQQAPRQRALLPDLVRRMLGAIPGRSHIAANLRARGEGALPSAPRAAEVGDAAPAARGAHNPEPHPPIPPGIGMRSTLDGLRGTSRAMHQEIRERVRGLRSPQQMLVLVSVQMDTSRVMRVVSMVGDKLLCTERTVEVHHPRGEDVGAWKLESLRCRPLNSMGRDDLEELGMGPARTAWEAAIAAANAARARVLEGAPGPAVE